MASHPATNTASRNHIFGLPSRLIPGTQSSVKDGARKKPPASVQTDGRRREESDLRGVAPKLGLLKKFPDVFLPQPSVRGLRWRLAAQVAADILCVALSFYAVSGVGMLLELTTGASFTGIPFPASSRGLLLLYGILFTLLGYSERLYHPDVIRVPRRQHIVLGKAVFWSTVLTGACIHWSGIYSVSLVALAFAALFSLLFMLGWRVLCRLLLLERTQTSPDARNVLIVGASESGRRLARHLQRDPGSKRVVLGFIDENEPVGGEVRGRVADLALLARSEFVDEIILTTVPRAIANRVIWEAHCNRIDIKVVPDLFGFDPDPLFVERLGGVPVLTLREEQIPALGLFLKRIVDIGLSSMGLLLTMPLLAMIALAIKWDSKGPVFYKAYRVGFKGRKFACCKFRTMVIEADKLKEQLRQCNERRGPTFKIVKDPRVTRLGRLLRRYSLDELPQPWNVLCGEMSLVGPRPHPLDDFERYELEDLQRLSATPGMTGLWQVTARHDPSFERNVALDREYIESWSLWKDFWILYKTVSVVLQGSGA